MYSHTIYTLYTLSLYVYIHDASLTAYQASLIRHSTVLAVKIKGHNSDSYQPD